MATPTRIYTVTEASTGRKRLIRAVSSASARSFAAFTSLAVTVSTHDELINLTKAGLEVEDASVATVAAAPAHAPEPAPAADTTEEQKWA